MTSKHRRCSLEALVIIRPVVSILQRDWKIGACEASRTKPWSKTFAGKAMLAHRSRVDESRMRRHACKPKESPRTRCRCMLADSYVTFRGPGTKLSICIHAIHRLYHRSPWIISVIELDSPISCFTFLLLIVSSIALHLANYTWFMFGPISQELVILFFLSE